MDTARSFGIPVIFVRTTHSRDTDTREWLARGHVSGRQQTCQEGTWGSYFYRMEPAPNDSVIEKHRYGAFTNTSLDGTLRTLNRSSLFFCGVSSNVCVETSLRQAVCADYMATFVEDCCQAYSPLEHQQAMDVINNYFGHVVDSDYVSASWRRQL
jgi:ureidoacrylate peracid hydrolase